MPATATGAQLTEAHRLAQINVVSDALRDLLAVWPLLDPSNVDGTFERYSRLLVPVIGSHKERSARTASNYLKAFREAEGAKKPVDVALLSALAREQAMTSLLVTGPVAVKVAARNGHDPDRAARLAFAQTAGAVTRLVQSGGRDTIEHTIRRDPEALGFARVTDSDPCYRCAMYASRGATYKSEASAGFEAHDGCNCTPEPIYSSEYELPGRGSEFSELWSETTGDFTGPDKVRAFRREYEARRRAS